MCAAKAEALALIIDVSPSMQEVTGDGPTSFDKAMQAANNIIQRKVFTNTRKNKDEAAIILFGTSGTANGLHDESGGYEHVTLAHELSVIDLSMLKYVNAGIRGGSAQADFIDALIVALDHLRTKTLGRKMDEKIVLFSDMRSPFEADQLEAVVGGMKQNGVNFIFIGPECDEDEGGGASSKPLSAEQQCGLQCMRHVLEEVDGEGMSFDELLPMLSFFEKRSKVLRSSARTPIEIGDLKINTYIYVKTLEERPYTWKKMSALAENSAQRDTMDVDRVTTHHLNDEQQTEIPMDQQARGYRYGKTLVPLTVDDETNTKLKTEKVCSVLGFTLSANIERSQVSGGTHLFVPQPGDEHAAIAFSALCHALDEKDMVAIIRLVTAKGRQPKIGYLRPHIKSSYEALIFVGLPFNEDLRTYPFPSLSRGPSQPTTEQLNAVDDMIDGMQLVTSAEDTPDDLEEEFKPNSLLNPVTQRQCQCIQSRALNEGEISLPTIQPFIEQSVKPAPEMAENCKQIYDKIRELFPLQEEEKRARKEATNIFQMNGADAFKLDTTDGQMTGVGAVDENAHAAGFSFASLSRQDVTDVGTATPVEDFRALTERADQIQFRAACEKMKQRLDLFIHKSFMDQHYQKALDCLRVLRELCLQFADCSIYNDLLKKIKEDTLGKKRNDFLELMKKDEGLKLIDSQEYFASTVSPESAKKFFENGVNEIPAKEDVEEMMEEDADDLLDLL